MHLFKSLSDCIHSKTNKVQVKKKVQSFVFPSKIKSQCQQKILKLQAKTKSVQSYASSIKLVNKIIRWNLLLQFYADFLYRGE